MHQQVPHPGFRQVELQRLPMPAVVEGHVDALGRAGIQQAAPRGIGAHHRHEFSRRQPGIDLGPRLAEVAGAQHVRAELILALVVDRDISRGGIERGGVQRADLAPWRERARRDLAPAFAAIAGELDQAVIGAYPDHLCRQGRGGDAENHAIAAGRGGGDCHRFLTIRGTCALARQVRTDNLPVRAAVRGAEQYLCAVQQRMWRRRSEHQRRDPSPAIFQLGRPLGVAAHRPGRDVCDLSGALIPA